MVKFNTCVALALENDCFRAFSPRPLTWAGKTSGRFGPPEAPPQTIAAKSFS